MGVVPFIVYLSVYATGVIFKKWFPVPMRSRLVPTFFSMRLFRLNLCGGI